MNSLKSWHDFERERKALQAYSPRFSRAELCRRAGISETTMFKGLKDGLTPTRRTHGKVRHAIEEATGRLTDDQRAQLELVIEAERHMVNAGLRS